MKDIKEAIRLEAEKRFVKMASESAENDQHWRRRAFADGASFALSLQGKDKGLPLSEIDWDKVKQILVDGFDKNTSNNHEGEYVDHWRIDGILDSAIEIIRYSIPETYAQQAPDRDWIRVEELIKCIDDNYRLAAENQQSEENYPNIALNNILNAASKLRNNH